MSQRSGRRARGARNVPAAAGPQIEPIADILRAYPEFPRIVDDRRHAIQQIEAVPQLIDYYSFNGGKRDVCNAYSLISQRSPRLKSIIDATHWQYVCQVDEARHDNQLVLALIERWWPTTHTFHLPNIEVGFTPYDFTCITGLPCALGTMIEERKWGGESPKEEKLGYFSTLFPTLANDARHWVNSSVQGIRMSRVKTFFERDIQFEPLDEDVNRELSAGGVMILRLFFALVIGKVWLPNSPGVAPFGVLHAIEDVFNVQTFDWGSAIMAQLYNALDQCATMACKSFQGCWMLLQYWYWEHFGSPAPLLKNPQVELCPRILRWAPIRLKRGQAAGQAEHSVVDYRLRLEESTWFTICINPYAQSQLFNEQFFNNLYNFSHCRTVLAGAGHCEWYLGERLHPYLHMANDRFGIPYPPPQSMQIDETTYLRWVAAGSLPIPADRVRGVCTMSDWVTYWGLVSSGGILDGRFRHVNKEYVNPAAGCHFDLLPLTPPSHAGPSGPVEPSARPANLADYYTPDLLQLGDGSAITLQPQHVDLPVYASSEAWRRWGQHEQGLLMATRNAFAERSADYAEMRRNLEEARRDAARYRSQLSTLGQVGNDYDSDDE